MIKGDALDAGLNPSILSFSKNHSITISATPARFGLSELAIYEIGYNRNIKYCVAGINCSLFGFELYKELSLGLTFSKTVATGLHTGININYNSVTIKNYGSSGAMSLDAGLLYEISGRISAAFSFTNISGAEIGGDRICQTLNAGLGYKALDELFLSIRIEKEKDFDASVYSGVDYKIIKRLSVRFGICAEPAMFFGGFGFGYSNMIFDYAFSFHSILGDTHSFSIGMKFDE